MLLLLLEILLLLRLIVLLLLLLLLLLEVLRLWLRLWLRLYGRRPSRIQCRGGGGRRRHCLRTPLLRNLCGKLLGVGGRMLARIFLVAPCCIQLLVVVRREDLR